MQQIADRLGLSKFAVSKALSGQKGVSEQTRQLVIDTAKALGYVPAVAPSDGDRRDAADSYILVWTAPGADIDPLYWQRVLSGIQTGCEQFKWKPVQLQLDAHAPIAFPEYLDRNRCVGILLAGTHASHIVLDVRRLQLPVVLVNHYDELAGLDAVLDQNLEAGMQAVRRLHGSGCRTIAFIGNERMALSFQERKWGFQTAAAQLRIDDAETCEIESYPNDGWPSELERRIAAIMQQRRIPDGWIAANDHIALELIKCLQRHGIAVPGQTKVIGFDNIESSGYTTPALTTFELAMEKLGIRAVEALHRRVGKPEALPETVRLAYRLIVRDSG